jgi:hypothetical protein
MPAAISGVWQGTRSPHRAGEGEIPELELASAPDGGLDAQPVSASDRGLDELAVHVGGWKRRRSHQMTCSRRELWAPMVEEKPKLRRSSGGMRWTALSLGARGESRGRREHVRRGGLARRGERAKAEVALGWRR